MSAEPRLKRSYVGIELVRQLAAEGDRVFSTARARELAPRVRLEEGYLNEALYHLRRTGWIVPVRRGLYALASTVPGVTPVHEFEIAMALANPAAVSHGSALQHHGLTEQIPRTVFVLTTTEGAAPRRRGAVTGRGSEGLAVGDTTFRFVRVRPDRFFGVQKAWIGEARVSVADPERTLLDGLSQPQYCGDFAEVLHAFAARGGDLDLDRIVAYALRLDAATAKRLGWVLEHQGVDPAQLARLLAVPTQGYRKLDPTGPRRGPCHARWQVQENLPGRARP